jgi:murein DD-endopeptidase MepM/ murein hydrolase activator NlpD
LRRLVLLGLTLSLACAGTASAHRDPTTDGFRHGLVIRQHVVVSLLPLSWPAKGSITGVYGNDDGRRHPGIDIGILRSLNVEAAAPGRVLHTGYVRGYEGYGKIVLERSGKFLLLYAHLSKVKAQRGDLIARGRRIGIAGCTGWCTGTHLHFEIRRGQRTLNPMKLLRR